MKITGVRLRRLRLPLDPPFEPAWDPKPRHAFEATLVFVDTDEGLTGIGSGDTMDGFERYVDLFVGGDPLDIGHHVRVLETITFHAGRYWPFEAALWDLAGKAAGVPVAQLLGGALDGLAAYASTGDRRGAAARAESALALREQGFGALKVRIDRRRIEDGLAAVEAVRNAVGPSMEIMVDLNQGWRMPGDTSPLLDAEAVDAVAARLRDAHVCWLEEPLAGHDLAGLARLRARGGLRLAGGLSMPCWRWGSSAPASWPSGCSRAGFGSRRMPGRTASACSPISSSPPGSAAAPSSSSRWTRRAGRPRGATSCSPSPCRRMQKGAWSYRPAPASASSSTRTQSSATRRPER